MNPTKTNRLSLMSLTLRYAQVHGWEFHWLHVALADGNLEDNHIGCCLRLAIEHDDVAGIVIAEALLEKSVARRERFYRELWKHPHARLGPSYLEVCDDGN